jgi:lysozyme
MSSQAKTAGIDVSHYQGTIDWNKVKQAGVAYAFIKATESSSLVDNKFQANWQASRDAGVIRGAYHFFKASSDATAQAHNFVETIISLSSQDLPPVLDVEAGGGTASNISSSVQTWLDVVEQQLGRKPMIYTVASFWNSNLTNQFGDYPLWVANYGVQSPKLPNGWTRWSFWQYSQSGTVSGVAGSVDQDWFNGSAQDLSNFLQQSGAPQPPATAAPQPAAPTEAAAQTYTVKAGDSLGRIASNFGVTVSALSEANNIENPNMIRVGQVLTIP